MHFLTPLLAKLGELDVRPPKPPKKEDMHKVVEQLRAISRAQAPSVSLDQRASNPGDVSTAVLGKKALRLILVDSAGIRRCRVVPGARIPDVLAAGISMPRSCMALPIHSSLPVKDSGLTSVGEVCMVPVPGSIVDVPWCPGHAIAPVCLQTQPGVAWQCCPRTALQRAITGLQDEYSLQLRASFETQFMLLKLTSNSQQVPVSSAAANQSNALDEYAPVLDEMVEALTQMGVTVREWHADAAPGQFTIATGTYEVLQAADKLMLTRECIAGIARKHTLQAVFAPKYGASIAGGCTCFLSLWKPPISKVIVVEKCVMAEGTIATDGMPTLTETANRFFGGILASMAALLPFTSPAFSSYARLSGAAGVATHKAWGWHHAGTPLSFVEVHTDPDEVPAVQACVRVMDGASNPYIALTALIAGGLLGFLLNSSLPGPMQVPVSSQPWDVLSEQGIEELPAGLNEALTVLGADNPPGKGTLANEVKAMMATLLSQELLTAYLAVRRAESESPLRNAMDMALLY